MKVHGSHQSSELGIWAPLIPMAVTAYAFFSDSPKENVKEKKKEIKQERKELKQTYEQAQQELKRLRSRLEKEMTPEQAARILQSNASVKRDEAYARWRDELDGLPRADATAQQIAEQYQNAWLSAAESVQTSSNLTQSAGVGAALIGGAGLAYSLYQQRFGDDS